MSLEAQCYKDFIKRDYLGGKVETGVPSRYLLGPFWKLMEVISKYFTCEGRFDRILLSYTRKTRVEKIVSSKDCRSISITRL
jgi:hypothetical protein